GPAHPARGLRRVVARCARDPRDGARPRLPGDRQPAGAGLLAGRRADRARGAGRGRAGYGEQAVVRLARDRGFGRSDRYRMLQFYRTYPVVTAL
ncbi:MAG: hypothetical protein AVDCRST_MAG18-3452, partial [uncultured Thermomicrobiales bacterium]